MKIGKYEINLQSLGVILVGVGGWLTAHQVGLQACVTSLDLPPQIIQYIGWGVALASVFATSQLPSLVKKNGA